VLARRCSARHAIALGRGLYNISYTLVSTDRLNHLADESVDDLFTDPRFGANIFYSDMKGTPVAEAAEQSTD
jgi:hypothetical protein